MKTNNKNSDNFIFQKGNYVIMALGLAFIALGFFCGLIVIIKKADLFNPPLKIFKII